LQQQQGHRYIQLGSHHPKKIHHVTIWLRVDNQGWEGKFHPCNRDLRSRDVNCQRLTTISDIATAFLDFGEIQTKVPRTKSTAKSTFNKIVVGNLLREVCKN
jgi:hypothetical protein